MEVISLTYFFSLIYSTDEIFSFNKLISSFQSECMTTLSESHNIIQYTTDALYLTRILYSRGPTNIFSNCYK
jgi:hypothetical protein